MTIQPSGQRALLTGDNTALPYLDFMESPENVRASDRVVSSGDGGLFPPGLLVGQAVEVLIPAALEGQLSGERAKRVQTRLVLEGANGPTTAGADAILVGEALVVGGDPVDAVRSMIDAAARR